MDIDAFLAVSIQHQVDNITINATSGSCYSQWVSKYASTFKSCFIRLFGTVYTKFIFGYTFSLNTMKEIVLLKNNQGFWRISKEYNQGQRPEMENTQRHAK